MIILLNVLAPSDSRPEISLRKVRTIATHSDNSLLSELLLSMLGKKVILVLDKLNFAVNPLESVVAVAAIELSP